MPIRFYCEACAARIKVPDGTSGKRVQCPGCGHAQRVPDASVEEEPAPVTAEPARARKTASAPVSTPNVETAEDVEQVMETPSPVEDVPEATEPELETHSQHAIKEDHGRVEHEGPHTPSVAESAEDWSDAENEEEDEDTSQAWDEEHDQDEAFEQEQAEAYEEEEVDERGQEQDENESPQPAMAEVLPADEIDETGESEWSEQSTHVPDAPVATPVARPRRSSSGVRQRSTRVVASNEAVASGGSALLIVGWLLRVLAGLSVAGSVKVLLMLSDGGAGVVDLLFIAPLLLGMSALFWAVGEIALAVRRRS